MFVRLGPVVDPPGSVDVYGHKASPQAVALRFPEVGAFLVSGGREILAEPLPGLDERVLRLFVLGPALGVLVHQREGIALHGSAALVDGRAVVFLGDSEWGKSTAAAACYREGMPLVADDVAWIEGEGIPTIRPAYPQIKLWPDSARALGWDPDRLRRVHPDVDKVAVRAEEGFPDAPVGVAAVYVLAPGDEGHARPTDLTPHEAFVELVRHTFTVDLLEATGQREDHFARCVALADAVRFRRLPVGSDPAEARLLPSRILKDLGSA